MAEAGIHTLSEFVEIFDFLFWELVVYFVRQDAVIYGLLCQFLSVGGQVDGGVEGWVDKSAELGYGFVAGFAGDDEDWGFLIGEHGLAEPLGELVGFFFGDAVHELEVFGELGEGGFGDGERV